MRPACPGPHRAVLRPSLEAHRQEIARVVAGAVIDRDIIELDAAAAGAVVEAAEENRRQLEVGVVYARRALT